MSTTWKVILLIVGILLTLTFVIGAVGIFAYNLGIDSVVEEPRVTQVPQVALSQTPKADGEKELPPCDNQVYLASEIDSTIGLSPETGDPMCRIGNITTEQSGPEKSPAQIVAEQKTANRRSLIWGLAIGIALLLGCLCIMFYIIYWNHKKKAKPATKSQSKVKPDPINTGPLKIKTVPGHVKPEKPVLPGTGLPNPGLRRKD